MNIIQSKEEGLPANPYRWWNWELDCENFAECLESLDSSTLVDLLRKTTEQARYDCQKVPPLLPWMQLLGQLQQQWQDVATLQYQQEPNNFMFWRGDPVETFSDWTIDVVVSNSGNRTRYHVHKNILAFGKRKSYYFEAMFRKANGLPTDPFSRCANLELELDAPTASTLPIVLDYLYSPQSPLQISSQTAMALLYWSEYLDIPSLQTDALAFCQKDLSLATVDIYLEQAALFHTKTTHSETILKLVAELFFHQWVAWTPSRLELLKNQQPAFLVSLLLKIVALAQRDGCKLQQQSNCPGSEVEGGASRGFDGCAMRQEVLLMS